MKTYGCERGLRQRLADERLDNGDFTPQGCMVKDILSSTQRLRASEGRIEQVWLPAYAPGVESGRVCLGLLEAI
jgi:hypothetical protein